MRTTRPAHHTIARAVIPAAVTLITFVGCSGSRQLIQNQAEQIDLLLAANDVLRAEIETYQDSISFYEFIDSGEYYQEMRTKEGEINRLEYSLAVCRDGGVEVASELVDELFEPASARLTERGKKRLTELADVLFARVSEGRFSVEGYSDSSRPAGEFQKRYPTNWDLSAARAAAVARYLVETHHFREDDFVIISHGASSPVASNDTSAGRRLNRRIRITQAPNSGAP